MSGTSSLLDFDLAKGISASPSGISSKPSLVPSIQELEVVESRATSGSYRTMPMETPEPLPRMPRLEEAFRSVVDTALEEDSEAVAMKHSDEEGLQSNEEEPEAHAI